MEINVQDSIKKNPELAKSVAEATKVLESLVGPSADNATAEWSLEQDGQPSRVGLRIVNGSEQVSVERQFTSTELTNLPYMESRLDRLWDEFLDGLLQKHMARLKELVKHLDEE